MRMVRRPNRVNLESERRRQYFKTLSRVIARQQGVTLAEAGVRLHSVIEALQELIINGEGVDLGFMNLKAVTVKPATLKLGFRTGDDNTTYMTGETKRWHMSLRRGWLKKTRPGWSRY